MPTYAYTCDNCGDKEIFQSIMEDTLTACPQCNTMNFKKVYKDVGIIFKGKGFYSTDSKNRE